MRAAAVRLALAAALLLPIPSSALAATRSVGIAWTYPTNSAPYVGVALYHAASRANLDAGVSLTRVDLGRPGVDSAGVARATVAGFDDQRDYYIALRVYDASGNESINSNSGLIAATAPTVPSVPSDPVPSEPTSPANSAPPVGDSFESYRAGQDPDDWEDSAPGSTATGDAALFETVALSDGSIAFGTDSNATDIHSHFLTSAGRDWSSYEYTGRIRSATLDGEAGVTFLSQFPTQLAYYRLARTGAGPFTLSVRGTNGQLACAASPSTGVAAPAAKWMRFRVRVTRFDGRNRIRATVYRDGTTRPDWQADCWDLKATSLDSGSIGVYASGAAGTYWDDLRAAPVANDGAPAAYQPTAPVPPSTPPAGSYTSRNSLVHYWVPGLDPASLGRDFASRGTPIDVGASAKGVNAKDVGSAGTGLAFVDLDGGSESLGNLKLATYGMGDTWSLAAWVLPSKPGRKKARYILDLNGQASTRAKSRISLVLDPSSRFAIEVSDASGRLRALSASQTIDPNSLARRWYHVAVVKTSNSLTLYIDGTETARTDVGVPLQGDVERALRVGTRVKSGKGYGFAGGVGSVALWNAALGSAEVRALWANGNRATDPR